MLSSREGKTSPDVSSHSRADARSSPQPVDSATIPALSELYALLQQYAPTWFTKAQEDRVRAALEERRLPVSDVLSEVFQLLEQYAPSWYEQPHHEKAKAALRQTENL